MRTVWGPGDNGISRRETRPSAAPSMLTRDSGTTSRRRMPVTGAGREDGGAGERGDGRDDARTGGDAIGARTPSKGTALGDGPGASGTMAGPGDAVRTADDGGV